MTDVLVCLKAAPVHRYVVFTVAIAIGACDRSADRAGTATPADTATPTGMPTRADPVTRDAAAPIIYLSMDGELTDRGSLGFPVTAVGDEVEFADGVRGQAVFIGGTEDWIEIGIDERLRLDSGATLQLWMRRDDWANPYRNGAGVQTIATVDPVTLDLRVLDASDPSQNRAGGSLQTADELVRVRSNVAVPAMQWTHLALVYDASTKTASFYLNGEALETVRGVDSLTTRYVNPFKIGTWYKANQAFRGWVDEVTLYAYARSPAEIAEASTP